MFGECMHVFTIMQRPSDVLFYRSPLTSLERAGNTISVYATGDEWTRDLLRTYGISHTAVPTTNDDGGCSRTQLETLIEEVGPDVVTGIQSPTLGEVASTVDATPVLFRDDTSMTEMGATHEDSPQQEPATVDSEDRDSGQERSGTQRSVENGSEYRTLAYVIPERFEQDRSRFDDLDIEPEEKYFLVDGGSTPDETQSGPERSVRDVLVSRLSEYGAVYLVTPDGIYDRDMQPLGVSQPALHDVLAGADLYVGNSPRVARETGLLRTPTIWTNPDAAVSERTLPTLISCGLVVPCWDSDSILHRAEQLAPNPVASAVWKQRHRALLTEQYDETSYVLDTLGRERSEDIETAHRSSVPVPHVTR